MQPPDTPLSPRGLLQARAVAERLRAEALSALWSSDLPRAWQTADAIARACGLAALPQPLLHERNFGDLRGRASFVSTARTAIGTFGGSLKDVPLADLATTAVKAASSAAARGPPMPSATWSWARGPTEPRDFYLSRVAAIERRPAQGDAGLQRQPPVRLGPAGHHLGRAVHPAGRLRSGRRRRRREHEPRPLPDARRPLGRPHGRRQDARLMVGASCTTPSTRSTWASRPRTWPSSTASAAA
jgi:hypothetical protein